LHACDKQGRGKSAQICKKAARRRGSMPLPFKRNLAPMNDVLLLAPCVPPPQRPSLRAAWRRLWQRLTLSERDAYLSKATDCADLERRQRAWDRTGSDVQRSPYQDWP
jgi:hypothetical protein